MNDVKANILLVDDNHDNLRFLASVLAKQKYEVRPTNSGEKALAAIEAKQPDLILLDIRMPGMSGYEVCERLKADEHTRDIPVIFISALNEVDGKVKAFSLGAVDYVTKPFQEDEVLARVEAHLNLRKFQALLEKKNASLKQEIMERKQAEIALHYRINFEEIIMNISSKFIRLSPKGVDEGISEALKTMGEFAEVDRAYVFQFREDKQKIDNTHEWCARGIESQILQLKGIPIVKELPWFSKKIKARETLHVPSVSELPQEAVLEKKHFLEQKIQSLIVVPMVSGNMLTGFLGFDSVRSEQKWPKDIIALLRIIGEVISNALERKRAEEVIRESEEKYRTLFESSRDAVMLLNRKRFIGCNDATLKVFGCTSRKKFCTKHPSDLSPSIMPNGRDSRSMANEHINTALREGHTFFEWVHRRMDGTDFPAEVQLSLFKLKGKPVVQAVVRDITERKKVEEERKELIKELQLALDEVKALSGLLPICSFCKNIRDDKGYWQAIETYIAKYSEAEFTHSMCNKCLKKHYPDIYKELKDQGKIE